MRKWFKISLISQRVLSYSHCIISQIVLLFAGLLQDKEFSLVLDVLGYYIDLSFTPVSYSCTLQNPLDFTTTGIIFQRDKKKKKSKWAKNYFLKNRNLKIDAVPSLLIIILFPYIFNNSQKETQKQNDLIHLHPYRHHPCPSDQACIKKPVYT